MIHNMWHHNYTENVASYWYRKRGIIMIQTMWYDNDTENVAS